MACSRELQLRRLRMAALLLLLFSPLLRAASPPISLDQGWEYRWGDSPVAANGLPDWIHPSADAGVWHAIDFPSNPPDRNGRTSIWYRITLPYANLRDPVLYVFSIDLLAQVYMDGRKIYQYGSFDPPGSGQFEGWPWHEISLPENFAGRTVYFRVFSNYRDIGLWGEVKLMGRPDLMPYILANSGERLVASGFSLLLALLAAMFALVQRERRHFAAIALFSAASGVMILAESQASQLILNKPLLWDYLGTTGYFMLPVAVALLLAQWFDGARQTLMQWLWRGHLAYATLAIGLSLAGEVALPDTLAAFDGLFLLTLITMFAVLARAVRSVPLEQKLIIAAYGLFGLLLLTDMAVAHGLLPWGRVPVAWGALAFSLAVVIISLRDYALTQSELRRLNQSLERQVAERTEALEAMAAKERVRVRMLTFENQKNQILNEMISELQSAGDLNAGYQLLARTLPALCAPLAGSIYQRHNTGPGFTRLNAWGDPVGDGPPLDIDARDGIPATATLPLTEEHGDADSSLSQWCFRIIVQNAEHGSVMCGLLFLDIPDSLTASRHYESVTQLFQSVDRAISKISVTLSSLSLRDELKMFSYEDALTGLKNRRFFDQLLKHEIAVAKRLQTPLSILIADIDHFKQFNDQHGHEAGDVALCAVATSLESHFRESDVACRYGGEEFVVVLPGAGGDDARERAERVLAAIGAMHIQYRGRDLGSVTLSIGMASWPEQVELAEDLLGEADQALYRAKALGRRRIVAACADS